MMYLTTFQIYEFDRAHFITPPGIVWQTALKKTKVKLDLLANIDMLLMVERVIRGGIFISLYLWMCKKLISNT